MTITHTTNAPYVYTCGCLRHADQTWTLCDECSSRIGILGTCPGCGGAQNEDWVTSYVPEQMFCSAGCAELAAWYATED
jgi:hypothetical protein